MNARKLGVYAAVILLTSNCFASGLIGKKAPDITLREWITTNPPDIKNLAGKVCVIDFWATWCHPCVEGIGRLIELNNKYAGKIELIALSQDKSAPMLRRFVREKKINYHVAIDNGTTDWFGVKGYPTIVVVDHLGKVTWQGLPWKPGFEKAIAEAVENAPPPLLAGVDLGPFKKYAKALWGGKKFASAYHKIKAKTYDSSRPVTSASARLIIAAIDRNLLEKIRRAQMLSSVDPLSAYYIYDEIIRNYDGIELVKIAKAQYQKLKNSHQFKKLILAAKIPSNFPD